MLIHIIILDLNNVYIFQWCMSIVHLGQRLVGIRHTKSVNKNSEFKCNFHGWQNYENMW